MLIPLVNRDAWSGDGDLTRCLLDVLGRVEEVALIKVEDAPASHADAGFSFICNDLFVGFRIRRYPTVRLLLGVLPVPAITYRTSLTLLELEARLAGVDGIGPADYSDAGMLQYLRAERVTAAYQRRGQKLVEMVRVYEAAPAVR